MALNCYPLSKDFEFEPLLTHIECRLFFIQGNAFKYTYNNIFMVVVLFLRMLFNIYILSEFVEMDTGHRTAKISVTPCWLVGYLVSMATGVATSTASHILSLVGISVSFKSRFLHKKTHCSLILID